MADAVHETGHITQSRLRKGVSVTNISFLFVMNSPESVPYFYSYKFVQHPNGDWLRTEDKCLMSKRVDAKHQASPEMESPSQTDHYEPNLNEKNKSGPPAPSLSQKPRRKNKYKTTCRRCGSTSHRSTICPVFPWSNEICEKCHRFHHTDAHRDLEITELCNM